MKISMHLEFLSIDVDLQNPYIFIYVRCLKLDSSNLEVCSNLVL